MNHPIKPTRKQMRAARQAAAAPHWVENPEYARAVMAGEYDHEGPVMLNIPVVINGCPTPAQWGIIRQRAARPYWDCPADNAFAEEIETGWHDDSPVVQQALSDFTGQPMRISPMLPHDHVRPLWPVQAFVAVLGLGGVIVLLAIIQALS